MSAAVQRVLVLADPMIAALVGLLVEIAGCTPVFAAPNEAAMDALERLRPLGVLVLDAEHPAARIDVLFTTARSAEIGAAVFGPEANARDIAEIAGARSIPWFTIPGTTEQLRRALAIAAGQTRRAQSERRVAVEAVIAPDGTRILSDGSGTRWMVYDRRAATDRRAPGANGVLERIFVSDAGESRRYDVSADEAVHASADALAEQLARSSFG